jgi:hypothetical protein
MFRYMSFIFRENKMPIKKKKTIATAKLLFIETWSVAASTLKLIKYKSIVLIKTVYLNW